MAWRIGVDSGGTFTDLCLFDEEGGHIAELLSFDPIAVDQPTCGPQSELGVMTEKHLTHDPFQQ